MGGRVTEIRNTAREVFKMAFQHILLQLLYYNHNSLSSDGEELNMLRGNEMFLLIEFGFICRKNNYNCLQERGFKSTFVNILYHVFDSFQDSNSKHKVKQRLKCLVNLISTVLVLWGIFIKKCISPVRVRLQRRNDAPSHPNHAEGAYGNPGVALYGIRNLLRYGIITK